MSKKKKIIIGVSLLLLVIGGYVYYKISNTEETLVTKNKESEVYIKVYASGEVLRKGYYEVPSTWTLEDLIYIVGLSSDADTSDIDFSTSLTNGKTYNIPSTGISGDTNTGLININTATVDELITLSGIGLVIANRIIEYRSQTKFKSIDEIKKVSGIGDSIYNKIKDYITV